MRAVVVVTCDEVRAADPDERHDAYLARRFRDEHGIEIRGLEDRRLIFDSLDVPGLDEPESTVMYRVTYDDALPIEPLLVWVRPRGPHAILGEQCAVSLLVPPHPETKRPRYYGVRPIRAGANEGQWLGLDAEPWRDGVAARLFDSPALARAWCEGLERRRLLALRADTDGHGSGSLAAGRAATAGTDARTRAG